MGMSVISIRHYNVSDQESVLGISADTAYFGDPVEEFLEDRQLYHDAFARYYTENETSLVWVAEGSDGLVGFLLGCADTTTQAKAWRKYLLRRVLVRAMSGGYRLGRRTASFAWGMLIGAIRGEKLRIDVEEYPAHLQIDVRLGYRGDGVGRRLIEAYLDQLREMKVSGVHLETTSQNKAACHLYEKVGFQLLDESPSHFWSQKFGWEVKNRAYGLMLR
jgi:ribosomal protein S18 acetylase RimI-like enzyme